MGHLVFGLGAPSLALGIVFRTARFRTLLRSPGSREMSLSRLHDARVTEKRVEFASVLPWLLVGLGLASHRMWVPILAGGGVALGSVAWGFRIVREGRDSVQVGECVARARTIALALLWSLAADGVDLALIAACGACVGMHVSLASCLVVLASTKLVCVLPPLPAQTGTFAAVGLIAGGVPKESALVFALLYRLVQWLPSTLAGGILRLADRSARVPSPMPEERG